MRFYIALRHYAASNYRMRLIYNVVSTTRVTDLVQYGEIHTETAEAALLTDSQQEKKILTGTLN